VSKNFELMHKADQDQEIFLTGDDVQAVPPTNNNGHSNGHTNGHKHVPALDPATMDETVKLVQRLFFDASTVLAPRVVLFSGVDSSVGCTTICTSVAETLTSMWDKSCCIVDANIRKPKLHDRFKLENDKGLAAAVSNRGRASAFASQMYGGKLWVMPAGMTASNPAPLLNSPNLAARITELKNEFSFVIIDSPPANLYSDALTLGRFCDGVVLVLQSDATRRDVARKTKEIFDSASIPILGAVLNRRVFPIPQKLYDRL
jgi:capsular exopolysaccharide synthesis family protein